MTESVKAIQHTVHKDTYLTLAIENNALRVDFTAIGTDDAHSGIDFVLFINENAADFIEKRKNICISQKKIVPL